jgi:hypothetical protein
MIGVVLISSWGTGPASYRYMEALRNAGDIIIASSKKMEELEMKNTPHASDQSQDISKDCV